MPVIYVVKAYESNPVAHSGIAAAYDAAANGLYVVGKNAVHQAFFDKIINKDYVLEA